MKASKILAGLSAASIAASMLSMITVSADDLATKFGVQGFAQDNSAWAWNAKKVDFNADGSVELTYNYSDLLAEVDTATAKVGSAGIQFYDNNVVDGDGTGSTVTSKIEYKAVAEDGTVIKEGTIDFSKAWDAKATNWNYPEGNPKHTGAFVDNGTVALANQNDDWAALVAYGDITVTATVSDIAVDKKDPDPVEAEDPKDDEPVTLPYSTTYEGEYAGDWKSDGNIDLNVWEAVGEGKTAYVTIDSTRLEGYDYALAAIGDQHGWAKLYNEKAEAGSKFEWKANSIGGVTLKSSLTKEEIDNADEVILQDDGYFVYPAAAGDYKYTFSLSPEAIKSLLDNAADEPADDGSLWGGSMFQVYGVKINSVTVSLEAPREPVVVNPANEEHGVLDAWLQFAASDWSQSRWIDNNGEPGISVPINGDGSYSISYQNVFDPYMDDPESSIPGALVFTIDIPNVYDGPEGTKDANGKKYSDDNQRQLLYPGFNVVVDSIVVDGQEIEFDDSKFKFGNIENQTTNYRVELYNEYGTTKEDPAFDPAVINGDLVTVNFTVTGMDSASEDKVIYTDDVYTLYQDDDGSYYIVNNDTDKSDTVEVVDSQDEFPYDLDKVTTYNIGQVTIDGDEYYIMSVTNEDGDTYFYLIKMSKPVAATGAIVPAEWPVISQLNYSVPYDYTDTTSEDLFDYIKAIHDADPEANVEFRFQAIGTQEGSPVAAFLKVWEAALKSDGTPKLVLKNTNDWGKYVEVEQKTQEVSYKVTKEIEVKSLNGNGEGKYSTGSETKKIVAEKKGWYTFDGGFVGSSKPDKLSYKDDNGKDQTMDWPSGTLVEVTDEVGDFKANVTYYLIVDAPEGSSYKVGDALIIKDTSDQKDKINAAAETQIGGKLVDSVETEEKMEWHNYYITNEGLLNVQSTSDMAAGVTNNNRYSKLTAAQISTIRANDGIYYDDQYGSDTYGHFIVFGDGVTPKEYSFTLSASAIDQILEKSIRSNGGSLPYSTNTWKKAGVAMHGPIWLQAHDATVPTSVNGEKSLNARVYAVTTVKTPDQIPYMYGKADYKGMYTPVSDSSSTASTTSSTAAAAASSPAASAASGDANADTGAAAGFGIAGLLLAGAAMVCARKKH